MSQEPLPFQLARNSDPWTSHAAAESLTNIRESQRTVLRVLRMCGPMTDVEIAETLSEMGIRMSPSGARTRRSELVDGGLVIDTGNTKRLPSGRWAIVWAAI